MKRWDQESLPDVTVQTDVSERSAFYQWRQQTPLGELVHFVAFASDETTGDMDYRALLPRIVCHLLVNRIPDEGMEELAKALVEIWGFHSSRMAFTEVPLLDSRFRGRIVRTDESPTFEIDED